MINKVYNRVSRKIRRWYNQHHCYDFLSQCDGWEKLSEPVIGNEETGSIFDPYVYDFDGQFYMYASQRKYGSIILVKSINGETWGEFTTILSGIADSDWEEVVNRASVVRKDGIWYMWYTGQKNNKSCIGLAISKDGINFERCESNPVLYPQYDYERESVMNPCVLWDDDEQIFKMWYAAGETYEPDVICYATSKDGVDWKKNEGNPVLTASENEYDKAKVGGCDVKKISKDKYVMYYIGYQNIDNARICVATSVDGISKWVRNKNNPILSPSKGKWDSHAVYKPSVCWSKEEQKWYLWYNGRSNSNEYIGLAFKKEE